MDGQQLIVAHLNAALLAAVLAGLAVRRRHRLCWSFAAYAAATLLGNRLVATWPDVFFTARFWTLKESAYGVLKLAVAAEIGLLTFSQFPRARRLLVAVLVMVATAGLAAQLAPAGAKPGDAIAWVNVASPRGQASVLCLLAAVLGLAAYYRVPFHPFHRGILLGFGLYLVVYTGALTLLREFGAPAYPYYAALDPAAYAASVGVWAWAAWRRGPELSAAALQLQPWAAATS